MARTWPVVLLLVSSACAAPATDDPAAGSPSVTPSSRPEQTDPAPSKAPTRKRPPAEPGTVVVEGPSEFGPMIFDDRGQAIYLFEPEADGTPRCYDECATAWPPVLTEGPPRATRGLDPALVDTVARRDGSRQVTYGGWPLYFYAHEEPGQVLCHDVFLNGGLWLVVGPDGRPRPA